MASWVPSTVINTVQLLTHLYLTVLRRSLQYCLHLYRWENWNTKRLSNLPALRWHCWFMMELEFNPRQSGYTVCTLYNLILPSSIGGCKIKFKLSQLFFSGDSKKKVGPVPLPRSLSVISNLCWMSGFHVPSTATSHWGRFMKTLKNSDPILLTINVSH